MRNPFAVGVLSAACLLAGCQQTSSSSGEKAPTAPAATATASSPLSAAQARAAVGQYLKDQPNAAVYVLDSARVNDNDTSWQVLVPRTDWAGRMPNRARFEVSKATGAVRPAPVK